MKFSTTSVLGAWVIEPTPREDERGRFMRAWCVREFAEQGISFVPVQANMGLSVRKGTVRGVHYQNETASEAKLVRCTRGSMFDVVLDVRKDSATYGKWYGVELNPENGQMLFLPEGCAHGYQTLEDDTEMYYMASAYYTPLAATGVRFNDPRFNIQWPLPPTLVSEQDMNWPLVN
jgi:dTDP-4-dehydrorhamnose 3,5-epimerase